GSPDPRASGGPGKSCGGTGAGTGTGTGTQCRAGETCTGDARQCTGAKSETCADDDRACDGAASGARSGACEDSGDESCRGSRSSSGYSGYSGYSEDSYDDGGGDDRNGDTSWTPGSGSGGDDEGDDCAAGGGGTQHGVAAGVGGTFNDSVPALAVGAALIAAACAGAGYRIHGRLRTGGGDRPADV
ncbi:hypothetical protein GTY20_06080, partial [Streptomyces sp. SID4946]|nr:hypothetical protein [Streptomyces sp. SID4946]